MGPARKLPGEWETMIERIEKEGVLIGLIIRKDFSRQGISFFTDGDMSQQLAYMKHPAGKLIEPHVHNPAPREVRYTQEVLFIKTGAIRVDFYDASRNYLESRILRKGDVILLACGGHGFHVLEECEMIEVKQGPYTGDSDKTRFSADPDLKLKIIE